MINFLLLYFLFTIQFLYGNMFSDNILIDINKNDESPSLSLEKNKESELDLYIKQQGNHYVVLAVKDDPMRCINIIYDNDRNIIFCESQKEVSFNTIDPDILEVSFSYGTDYRICQYYSYTRDSLSKAYINPLAIDFGLIVCFERDEEAQIGQKNRVVVQNIFEPDAFREIIIRNFANYTDAEISAKFIDESNLELQYYIGEDKTENLLRKIEIINLS